MVPGCAAQQATIATVLGWYARPEENQEGCEDDFRQDRPDRADTGKYQPTPKLGSKRA